LAHLGLDPLVDLDLRLGEGTGACLALPILQAAAKVLAGMATFGDAGVTDQHE
jgi:nicotinate-nucleotide--dimethylbenzimidazole phosphoribosyltransferase